VEDSVGGPLTKKCLQNSRLNSELLIEFYECLRADILKVLIKFSEFIDNSLLIVEKKEQIIAFLNTKIKSKEEDPEERWIITWNDYLWRIKYFFRWWYNIKKNAKIENFSFSEPSYWTMPIFVEIKKIGIPLGSPFSLAYSYHSF
jgi:integrase/recombinase XerD